jgi:hypothetical protein
VSLVKGKRGWYYCPECGRPMCRVAVRIPRLRRRSLLRNPVAVQFKLAPGAVIDPDDERDEAMFCPRGHRVPVS